MRQPLLTWSNKCTTNMMIRVASSPSRFRNLSGRRFCFTAPAPPADDKALQGNLMDTRISEVIITLDQKWENDLSGACEQLKKAGLEITNADDDNNVVEGTIDVCKVHTLE